MKVTTKVRRWAIFSIVVPLLPMVFAGILKLWRGMGLDYHGLLGGTELYILSVTVLASTWNDLDNSEADFSQFRVYNILTESLIIMMIIISMMFAAVYIDEHVQMLDIQQSFAADAGILLGVLSTLNCIALQFTRFTAEKQGTRSNS